MIEKYGAPSVFGRVLSAGEIIRMEYAQFIVDIFQSRKNSNNWQAWVAEHPSWSELLAEAWKLAHG